MAWAHTARDRTVWAPAAPTGSAPMVWGQMPRPVVLSRRVRTAPHHLALGSRPPAIRLPLPRLRARLLRARLPAGRATHQRQAALVLTPRATRRAARRPTDPARPGPDRALKVRRAGPALRRLLVRHHPTRRPAPPTATCRTRQRSTKAMPL